MPHLTDFAVLQRILYHVRTARRLASYLAQPDAYMGAPPTGIVRSDIFRWHRDLVNKEFDIRERQPTYQFILETPCHLKDPAFSPFCPVCGVATGNRDMIIPASSSHYEPPWPYVCGLCRDYLANGFLEHYGLRFYSILPVASVFWTARPAPEKGR